MAGDDTYMVELYTSQGLFSLSDFFIITGAPSSAPTSSPTSSAGDSGATEVSTAIILVSAISSLVGAGIVIVGFLSYRSYKTHGRPTAWLYDTHLAMEGDAHLSFDDGLARSGGRGRPNPELELQSTVRTPQTAALDIGGAVAMADAVVVPPGKHLGEGMDGAVAVEATEVPTGNLGAGSLRTRQGKVEETTRIAMV